MASLPKVDQLIAGVQVKPLKVILDERGRLMEILRSDEAIFERFGQAYVTTARPETVKAWHYHKLQTDHWVCLCGRALVGLYDARRSSPTFGAANEFWMSPEEPFLLKIPIEVYHGFKGKDPHCETMIMNVPTLPYNYSSPDEYRHDPFDPAIPFNWRK